MPVKMSTVGLQAVPAKSILNPISLNASRENFSELLNNFKQINSIKQLPGSKSSLVSNGSIDLVTVTEQEPDKLFALYVGDLHPTVTEEALYNHFKQYPSLTSVKICYGSRSRNSLGYGYVNLGSELEAKKAIKDLNYTLLANQEIRIMPSLQGKREKYMGTNVFISNLKVGSDISLRDFYEKFRKFGEIISCKIDKVKNHGFISFADKEVAEKFVNVLDDSIVDGNRIHCSIHIPKHLRHARRFPFQKKTGLQFSSRNVSSISKEEFNNHCETKIASSSYSSSALLDPVDQFTQIYVKCLPMNISETEALKMFSIWGKVQTVFIRSVEKFNSCWGLITFESTSSAQLAIINLHNSFYKGRRITCVKALNKADRKLQLLSRLKILSPNLENTGSKMSSGVNNIPHRTYKVYIENLPDEINENFFKLFLRKYTFSGKILKYCIRPSSENSCNYIEFEKENDALDVNAKINRVNIAGNILKSALEYMPTIKKSQEKIKSTKSHPENYKYQRSITTIPSSNSFRNHSGRLRPKPYQFLSSSLTTNSPSYINNSNGSVYHLLPGSEEFYGKLSTPLSRVSSIREAKLQLEPTISKISLFGSLEEAVSSNVDFLKYPAATRPRNIKRIVQYLVDSHWRNDLAHIEDLVTRLQIGDSSVRNRFKVDLEKTLNLLGFARS